MFAMCIANAMFGANSCVCKLKNSYTLFENELGTGLLLVIVAERGSEGQKDDASNQPSSWHTHCVSKPGQTHSVFSK